MRARAFVRAHTRIVRGCPSSAVFAACHALDAQERGDVREAAAAPLSSSCQHHLGWVSHPPCLFSLPSGGPLSCVLKGIGPKASGEKCQRATQLLPERRRGADHLCSFTFCIFSLDSPAGRTAPVGQPRRAWMSRRSHMRRWSCCCFASPCGYCNTIQLKQTPSFISVSIKTRQSNNRSAG